MKRRIALFATAFLALAGCSKDDNNGASEQSAEIPIGAYLSLTGTTATFGTSTLNGVKMAVEEVNSGTGIDGKKINLIAEDTQSKPEEAATAVAKLIARDEVKALIGEIASSRTLAAAPTAQENKIPMVSPGSTNPEVTKKGDYIFRVCYLDQFQGEVIARFAHGSLGARKVAVITDVKNDYSVGLAEFFGEKFKSLGGEIIGEQAYSEGDTDFRAQLTAIKALNPDAIIVPGYYQECGLLVKQARELNMDMPIIGGDGWDSNALVQIGGEAMNGTYFTNHYAADDTAKVVQDFITAYQSKHNEVPDAMAVLGYDAARILFDAIDRANSDDPTAIRDALAATRNFPGVAGSTTIDSERNASKPIVIIKIVDGQFRLHEKIAP